MLCHYLRAQYFRLFCVNVDQNAANIGKRVVSFTGRLIIFLISSIVAKCDKYASIAFHFLLLAQRRNSEKHITSVCSLASLDLLRLDCHPVFFVEHFRHTFRHIKHVAFVVHQSPIVRTLLV